MSEDHSLSIEDFNQFMADREKTQTRSHKTKFSVPQSTDAYVAQLENIRKTGSTVINSPNFKALQAKAKAIIDAQNKKRQEAEQKGEKFEESDADYMIDLADGQQIDARMLLTLGDILKFNKDGSLTLESTADVLVRTLPMVAIPGNDKRGSLAVYDPDEHIYTTESTTILNTALVTLFGTSSNPLLASLTLSLLGRQSKFYYKYNPLPKYKIALGNGIFNGLVHQLEPFTPEYTVLTKIATNYNPKARQPKFDGKFSFEQMVNQLADENSDRISLLKQICLSIITGVSTSAALFIFLGKGGDGKSTFFQLLENVIGSQNTAHVNFSEINSDDKLLETMGKKLVVGLDNDTNIYIRKTAKLKSMAAHETVTYSRKYLSAVSVPFTATIVQLCNDMPRFSETGTSMRRRLVTFKAEHSYTLTGTENNNVSRYIQNREFLEYVLKEILNFGYTSNYNDVDRQITNDTLDEEDTIGQFVEDMDQIHLFDGVNKMLPLPHLYAAYLDWASANQQSSRPFSTRAFSAKITDLMADRGYVRQPTSVRLRTIIDSGDFVPASFDEISTGKHLADVLSDTKRISTRVFAKVGQAKINHHEFRRKDAVTGPVQYFGLWSEFNQFAAARFPEKAEKYAQQYYDHPLPYGDEDRQTETSAEAQHELEQQVLSRLSGATSTDTDDQSDGKQQQDQAQQAPKPLADVRVVIRDGHADDIDHWVAQANQVKSQAEVTTDLDRAIKQLSETVPDAVFQADYASIPPSLTTLQRQTELVKLAKILQQKLK